MKNIKEWEKEFENIFTAKEWNVVMVNKYHQVYEFIRQLLSQQKQEIVEEIERMKYIDKDFIEQDGMEEIGMKTRNLIIDQVLNQLNQKLTK